MARRKAFSAADEDPATGWSLEDGREVFRDDNGHIRGEVLFPDASTHFFRVNFTDGVQAHPSTTLAHAKNLIERHVEMRSDGAALNVVESLPEPIMGVVETECQACATRRPLPLHVPSEKAR